MTAKSRRRKLDKKHKYAPKHDIQRQELVTPLSEEHNDTENNKE